MAGKTKAQKEAEKKAKEAEPLVGTTEETVETEKTLSHIVTAADLERRPELIEQGINEDDEIEFDTQDEFDDFFAEAEAPKKRVALNTNKKSNAKGFDILRNGTYYIRTYEKEEDALAFLGKHELNNQSVTIESRMYYSMVPANTVLAVEVSYPRVKVTASIAANIIEKIKFSEDENGPEWKQRALDHAAQWPHATVAVTERAG